MNKRNPNYTKAETETLVSLVADYIDIIECKKSDTINLRRKEDSWKYIEKIFNRDSTVYRNHKELRKKYENLKANWKRKAPEETPLRSSCNNNNNKIVAVPTKKQKTNQNDDLNQNSTVLNSNEMIEIKNEIENDDYISSNTNRENNLPNKHLDNEENHAVNLEEFVFCDAEANEFWQKHSTLVNSLTAQCDKYDNSSDMAKSSTSSSHKFVKLHEKLSEEEKLRMETDFLREQHQEYLQNKMLERQFLIEKQEMAREKHKIEMDILRLELEKKKRELI